MAIKGSPPSSGSSRRRAVSVFTLSRAWVWCAECLWVWCECCECVFCEWVFVNFCEWVFVSVCECGVSVCECVRLCACPMHSLRSSLLHQCSARVKVDLVNSNNSSILSIIAVDMNVHISKGFLICSWTWGSPSGWSGQGQVRMTKRTGSSKSGLSSTAACWTTWRGLISALTLTRLLLTVSEN